MVQKQFFQWLRFVSIEFLSGTFARAESDRGNQISNVTHGPTGPRTGPMFHRLSEP